MKSDQLKYLSIFIQVAKSEGFRPAAKQLNMSASSVSEAILRLEDSLGTRLFQRTTRKISLTEAGQKLYKKSLAAMKVLENALEQTYDKSGPVTGTLCLSASQGVCDLFLNDILIKFAKNYPEIIIHLDCEGLKKDLVTSGLDAAIRLNALLDPETYAVPIGPPLEMAIIVAPSYLKKHATPEKPEDLTRCEGIVFSTDKTDIVPWTFGDGSQSVIIKPKIRFKTNNTSAIIKLTERGLGFSYMYYDLVKQPLEEGGLCEVLKDYGKKKYQYSLNYLNKKNMKAPLKAFIEFVKCENTLLSKNCNVSSLK